MRFKIPSIILSDAAEKASPIASPIPEIISPNQSNILITSHYRSCLLNRQLLLSYIPTIPQIYSGAVKVKIRQAKRIAGAVNSN